MYIKRQLEDVVRRASETFPVVMVTGPRQVGKTTMLEKLAGPELFLQCYPPPVPIDEFQYAKELLPFIKIHADKYKNNGDFWLTGSQMFHMMKQVSESLAAHMSILIYNEIYAISLRWRTSLLSCIS
ncbi:MAG: AAA family ATPase [Clostridiales bacterium]|jgi:predicted AAA+ superfamily ATPase|nr:AAA family ATPase [Clostridiales bacterium]